MRKVPVNDLALVSPSLIVESVVCECVTSIESALPPVAPTEYPLPAATTNLSCKFGVPLDPLHNAHPPGTDPTEPDHRIIPPIGVIPLPTNVVAVTIPEDVTLPV